MKSIKNLPLAYSEFVFFAVFLFFFFVFFLFVVVVVAVVVFNVNGTRVVSRAIYFRKTGGRPKSEAPK